MNGTKVTSTHRIAKPGDVFLLLIPSPEELSLLQEEQRKLQSRFGGEIVNFVHVTCERFSPTKEEEEEHCVAYLRQNVTALSPFMLYAEKLVQFFAPYWGQEVLRWQVKENNDYTHLRRFIAASLDTTGCGSHFDLDKPTTCTSLRLEEKIELGSEIALENSPFPLFKADHLWVSKLIGENEFTILAKIRMEDQSFLDKNIE